MKKMPFIIVLLFLLLSACNNVNEKTNEWEESPFFISNNYKMIGNEGRSGFIYDKKQLPMIKNQPNKYMWHFWGDKETLVGKIKVLGTHEENKESIEIIPKMEMGSLNPINGADQHMPTTMSFPKSGMWKLDAYINDKIFDTIYVYVKE